MADMSSKFHFFKNYFLNRYWDFPHKATHKLGDEISGKKFRADLIDGPTWRPRTDQMLGSFVRHRPKRGSVA